MASLEDLARKIREDQSVREDLLSTLSEFAQRHGIEASPEDFVGLGGEDTGGDVETAGGPPMVLIYRDGPRKSRWIDSG
jgi:hypothetical protein